jgi:signal peptidase II
MDPMEATRPAAAKAERDRVTVKGEGGKYLWVTVVALSIILLDQVTKLWVAASMRLHQSIPVVDGFFNLTYVRNTGAAFSLFADHGASFRVPFFVAASLVAVVVILTFVRQTPSSQKLALAGCAFVLGGAIGNLIDRVAYGEVIDFLDAYWGDWHWPAFNVADSFITVGVIVLLLRGILVRDEPAREE